MRESQYLGSDTFDHKNDNGGKEKSTTAEADDSQHSQPEVWKTKPETEEKYNRKTKDENYRYYKGEEWGAKYEKDSTTGLWMVPVSEKTCKASKGFVCKVSIYGRDVNDYDDVGDDDDDWSDIVWINILKVNQNKCQ